MQFPRDKSFGALFLCLLLSFAAAFPEQPRCQPGKQPLWYYPVAGLDDMVGAGFAGQLFTDLTAPLGEIGYCLRRYVPDDSAAHAPHLIMHIFARDADGGDWAETGKSEKELFVALAALKEWRAEEESGAASRPMFSLRYSSEDITTIRIIFVKKILENLRTHYICNVTVATEPPGVMVRADNGLEDKTPFEWVLPVGKTRIRYSTDGYLPKESEIKFPKPGSYHYLFQMKKRQFYHSKFMYPAAVAALSAAVFTGFEYVYYDRYHSLAEYELKHHPGQFGKTFRKAQFFERLAATSLAVSGVFIAVSFKF